MALDSYKGRAIDVGRNFEGTREGPFIEGITQKNNNGMRQSAVNNLVEHWQKVMLASPEEREVKEKVFNGILEASVRRLNSNGIVISKSELMKDVKSAYIIIYSAYDMTDLNEIGGR